jgi:prepilin signal peptidase PulO-like enzyme (type II secretory pathway)
VNAINALPLPVHLGVLALVGLLLGSAANWAIYALAYRPRPISPWQRPSPQAPPRRWSDFLPVIGWSGLARESAIHGRGFWIRPLLIELACAIGLPALYWWEVTGHLAPPVVLGPLAVKRAPLEMLHWEFVSHAILSWFLVVATFIDFDEQTIPDMVTIPGTLIGLVLAALAPESLLPVFGVIAKEYGPLLLTSTEFWPGWLDGWRGLLLGVGIFASWCLVLIPATTTLRRGWKKGVQYYVASMARENAWWQMLLLAAAGSAGIWYVWRGGGQNWQALLTALVGLAGGGLIVWGVRIVGWVALRKEAMGFGDVTLMAMIGTYLGWQTCLIIFFLSPLTALFVSVTQWILTGRRDIAFGPYLALTAVVVIVYWEPVWGVAKFYFQAGGLVPAFFAAGLLLMMGLLMLWRIIEQSLFAPR